MSIACTLHGVVADLCWHFCTCAAVLQHQAAVEKTRWMSKFNEVSTLLIKFFRLNFGFFLVVNWASLDINWLSKRCKLQSWCCCRSLLTLVHMCCCCCICNTKLQLILQLRKFNEVFTLLTYQTFVIELYLLNWSKFDCFLVANWVWLKEIVRNLSVKNESVGSHW